MTTSAKFWDGTAERYAKRAISNEAAYEETLRRVSERLPREGSVLELGCGTGSTSLRLAASTGKILATDYSTQMIAIAQRKAEEQDVRNVTFAVHDVLSAELDVQGPFDVAMCFNLLHLVPDLPATLKRMRDLIADDGLVVTKTPCLGKKALLFGPLVWAMRMIGKAPEVSFFTPEWLEHQFTQAGFEVIETAGLPPSLPSHFIVARKA